MWGDGHGALVLRGDRCLKKGRADTVNLEERERGVPAGEGAVHDFIRQMKRLAGRDLPGVCSLRRQAREDIAHREFSPPRSSGGEGSERRVHGSGCGVRCLERGVGSEGLGRC